VCICVINPYVHMHKQGSVCGCGCVLDTACITMYVYVCMCFLGTSKLSKVTVLREDHLTVLQSIYNSGVMCVPAAYAVDTELYTM